MELFDAINRRRSVREFLPEPVPREALETIVRTGVEAPSGCNMQFRHYIIVDDPAVMEKIQAFGGPLKTAPAAIVIVMDPQGTKYGEFWVQDASAAMENMLLAAVGLDYGACWVEGAIRRCEDKLRELLGVPENLRVWSLMPVGKLAKAPTRPEKSAFADVTHYNTF